MASRRVLKVAEVVREVVAMAILRDLKDPRIRDVTVIGVEVSGDLRQAKVHVSIMGDETRQALSLRGLQNAAGFLQSRLSDRIDSRFTPRIEFVLDQGVKKSLEISRILSQVIPKSAEGSHNELEGPDALDEPDERDAPDEFAEFEDSDDTDDSEPTDRAREPHDSAEGDAAGEYSKED